MTAEEDIASVAAQLAELTRTVVDLERELTALLTRADERESRAVSRAAVQQERLDHAARELAEVSRRLEAAANALVEP